MRQGRRKPANQKVWQIMNRAHSSIAIRVIIEDLPLKTISLSLSGMVSYPPELKFTIVCNFSKSLRPRTIQYLILSRFRSCACRSNWCRVSLSTCSHVMGSKAICYIGQQQRTHSSHTGQGPGTVSRPPRGKRTAGSAVVS